MSGISLRLPESLHKGARELAKEENISLNQLITLALAEKLAAIGAESVIASRAARGSRRKFDRAIKKVSKRAPLPGDELD